MNPSIHSYCILDDDSDMLEDQHKHFVRTSFIHGLTESDVQKCLEHIQQTLNHRQIRYRSITMSSIYQEALNYLLDVEGGYVFDPHDPGGETKYGITDSLMVRQMALSM